ncbi:MAG: site-specific DNA-methyltransferase, partial [Planctomycetes bacterium]|nr:site-specific DNA-methyltransferase [Planctomycetota bacterium]
PGKHPCEKPLSLLEHIVAASSKPGAVVLDAFVGGQQSGRELRRRLDRWLHEQHERQNG